MKFGLYTWARALRTLFMYRKFTKKKVFGQPTLAILLWGTAVMADKKCRWVSARSTPIEN